MKTYDELINEIQNFQAFKGLIAKDEPLAPKTTFKVGGKAELFIRPENFYSFQIALNALLESGIKFFVLGGGSNVVFTDETFKGVVLSTQDFSKVEYFPVDNLPPSFNVKSLPENKVLISCFSGTPMATLVNFCTTNNISDAEAFAGLPGSVGGAVYMNARCFETSISDILFSTSWMEYNGNQTKLCKKLYDPSEWKYKKSPFQNGKSFITTVTFMLTQKTAAEHIQIEEKCKKYIAERVDKGHFKFPSAGSVFKNNHDFGAPSGKLIDDCGLKGYTAGGAQVAPFHGNFIINVNHATAQDIKNIVEYVKSSVQNKFGFLLENEIIFVDN